MILPKRKNLVHKAVEVRNLSKKAVNALPEGGWWWQPKFDGCHLIVVIDNENIGHAFSRQGEPVRSCDHIVHDLEEISLPNTVYFGEAWMRTAPFPVVSGAFRRHSPSPELEYMLFDMVPLYAFEEGRYEISYVHRLQALAERVGGYDNLDVVPTRETQAEIEALMQQLYPASAHFDGLMRKQKRGYWIAGDGKGGEAIKVKDHVSVDLLVTQLIEGEGKFEDMLGAMIVEDSGGNEHTISAGKMTTKDRQRFWEDPDLLVGTIVEVHALGYTEAGALREPRYQRQRPDKTEAD